MSQTISRALRERLSNSNRHYSLPVQELDSVEEFDPSGEEEPRIFLAPLGDSLFLPFLFDPGRPAVERAQDHLRVGLHGAKTGKENGTFMFTPLALSRAAKAPFVLFDDPTLYLGKGVRLAWYAGTPDINPDRAMISVINSIREHFSIRYVIVQGSSGGGFAAMRLATQLDWSVATAMSPQTDIFRYRLQRFSHDVLELGWGGIAPEDAVRTMGSRFRTADAVSDGIESGNQFLIRYVQNTGDLHHVYDHLAPLTRELGYRVGETNLRAHRISVTLSYFGDGHVNAPREFWTAESEVGLEQLRTLDRESRPTPSQAITSQWEREVNTRYSSLSFTR